MRLFWLCFLLLGVSSLQIRRHEGENLAPSLLLLRDEPLTGAVVDVVTCNYVTGLDGSISDQCPHQCVPKDHSPRYALTHYTMDGSCPEFVTYEPCPNTTPCSDSDWPESCQVTFTEWTVCTATCGGGIQERHRSLPLACMSCSHCDVEYRECNTQACGRDCVLDDWQPWSACSHSCTPSTPVAAIQTRTRRIVQGIAPGRICDSHEYNEVRACDPAPPTCAVDCVVSEWGAFGPCSVTCGCGVQTRTRTVVTQPQGYGAPCPRLTETTACSCFHECPQKCEYSEWTYSSCSGDCYMNYTNADGETVIEYPFRRKTRYILREAKGGEPDCDYPCEMAKVEECRDVPQCPSDCKLTPWGKWLGECPACLSPGQPVPVQVRERSIISLGNGVCGCTREERICDINWCCEDCLVGNWTDWSPCIPTGPCVGGAQTGVRSRSRDVLRPANRCGARCPALEETQPCDLCCPVDCEVGSWMPLYPCSKIVNDVPVPLTCGSERGVTKYTRTITKSPNSCGAPCPETEKTLECYPPQTCCKVNCELGEVQYSPCYGCGLNARRWRKQIINQYDSCGGIPCCYYGGCALFRPVDCEHPPACPQTPCTYSEWGNYSVCSATCSAPGQPVPSQCRVRHLIAQPEGETCPDSLTDCVSCNTQCCPVDCVVGEWQGWGDWSPSCGLQVRSKFRQIITQPSCGGTACPPLVQHDTQTTCCPVDCVVEEWGSWSLCKPCVHDGEEPGFKTRTRAILIQPSCAGQNCPPDSELTQTLPCPSTPCDRNCEVSEWSVWGPCNAQCGDGFEKKTRTISVTPLGFGMACPPLEETRHCKKDCPNCVLGPLEYGPCTPTCSNVAGATGTRQVTRGNKPLVIDGPDGPLRWPCALTTRPRKPAQFLAALLTVK